MTDYTHSTGSAGTMMIRDTGTTVEFWLRCSSTSTFNHQLPWSYIVNGAASANLEFDFVSGGSWQKLGYRTITYSQTVTFKLGDTGTSGLGGPTTFSQYINRATAPSAPGQPTITAVTSTQMNVTFTDGANNGAAIDARQIARNTSNTTSGATIISSDGSTLLTGLAPGTWYWVWARTHNSEGWSPWSAARAAKTLTVPDAVSAPILTSPTQTSVTVNWTVNGNGGSVITGYDIAYKVATYDASGSPIFPGVPTYDNIVAVPGQPYIITGLSPGQGYNFYVRAKNAIGAGPWSEVRNVLLVAGARVHVGATWRRAVPYVKVGGVWKVARPWVKVSGIWKESQ